MKSWGAVLLIIIQVIALTNNSCQKQERPPREEISVMIEHTWPLEIFQTEVPTEGYFGVLIEIEGFVIPYMWTTTDTIISVRLHRSLQKDAILNADGYYGVRWGLIPYNSHDEYREDRYGNPYVFWGPYKRVWLSGKYGRFKCAFWRRSAPENTDMVPLESEYPFAQFGQGPASNVICCPRTPPLIEPD